MITRRQATEYFILAKIMSLDENVGTKAYELCRDFLLPDMFKDSRNRWVYKLICEMREKGFKKTGECDIFEYMCYENKVPKGKIGAICCWLIEVYLQFCGMTHPVTGVEWTMGEAVDELVKMSDSDSWELITR